MSVEEERPRGWISTEFTFWCGCCDRWEQFAAVHKTEASGFARGCGWRYTRAKGWLCPRCAPRCATKHPAVTTTKGT